VKNEHLLGHFLRHHLGGSGIELREVFEGNRLLIVFNPTAFDLGQNSCMSVLLYGGVKNRPCTLPITRFMPTYNGQLPMAFGRFAGHLPLFVMISRNRLRNACGRKVRFQDLDEEVFALWMATMDLPQPIYAVLTVFNRRLDATVSSIMKVRGLKKSPNCQQFLNYSRQYMRLREQDLKILTNNHTEPLYLEVSVKEYAG
ncbi:hypothetical protein KR009_006748, partial [Drosophila setifemur]